MYIPLFARALLDAGLPFAGFMVGDPLIDAFDEAVGLLEVAHHLQSAQEACGVHLVPALLTRLSLSCFDAIRPPCAVVNQQEFNLISDKLLSPCKAGMLSGNLTQAVACLLIEGARRWGGGRVAAGRVAASRVAGWPLGPAVCVTGRGFVVLTLSRFVRGAFLPNVPHR